MVHKYVDHKPVNHKGKNHQQLSTLLEFLIFQWITNSYLILLKDINKK